MPLAESYFDYLQNLVLDRQPDSSLIEQLCKSLQESGCALESELLQHFVQYGASKTTVRQNAGVWAGRCAWLGPQLPDTAAAGDIWFDTCEIMPMLLLPREPFPDEENIDPAALLRVTPFVSWMALRPVANWQFRAFLTLAQFASSNVQVEPPLLLFDADRILTGMETEAVRNLSAIEAKTYARWFGKGLCDLEDWQTANHVLTAEAMSTIWGSLHREWAGQYDEDSYVVVSPQTIHLEPDEEYDSNIETILATNMLCGEFEQFDDVVFRTHVSTQVGLLDVTGPSLTSFSNLFLTKTFNRNTISVNMNR